VKRGELSAGKEEGKKRPKGEHYICIANVLSADYH
jgi:hypothetical protein